MQEEIYRHYKGKHYKVISTHAEHTETAELFVVYHSLENPYRIWLRPWDMFHGMLEDGTQRFTKIT